MYHDLREDDKAIADYEEAIRQMPVDTSSYIRYALVFADKGDYARAIEIYDRALKVHPEDKMVTVFKMMAERKLAGG